MSNYGRNFEFRVPPVHGQRSGRFSVPTTGTAIAIGAPVALDGAAALDAGGRAKVALVTGATVPVSGVHGIAVYEYAPAAFAGDDPFLTVYSDKDTIPLGAAVQVVSGTEIKVVLRNTVDETFLNTREYDGKVFVAPANLTGLAVGDYLTPGVGDTTDGYWAETATVGEAWLVITKVDTARGEVEARMTF
jgi:hypothetical protein